MAVMLAGMGLYVLVGLGAQRLGPMQRNASMAIATVMAALYLIVEGLY
jgi:hypothetical protein